MKRLKTVKNTVNLNLAPNWERQAGHCQITYTCKNPDGLKIVYALQLHYGIRLVRCTQSWEPEYEVAPEKLTAKFIFEKPQGDSKLEQDVRAWIENYENKES